MTAAAPARGRLSPVHAWFVAGATAITVVLAGAVGASARPADGALVVAAGVLGLLGAIAQPRWVLVVGVFATIGYLPDALGGGGLRAATSGFPFLLALAIVFRHAAGIEAIRLPRQAVWFGGFGVALAGTIATSREMTLGMSELADYAGFAVLALSMVVLVDSAMWMRRLVWAVVAAMGLLAALTDFQQVTRSYASSFGGLATVILDNHVMRSNGPVSANFFGEVLAASSALAGYLALSARHRRERAAALIATAAILLALVYTQSRGAFVAVVAGAIVVAVLRRVAPRRLALIAVVVVAVGAVALPGEVKHRFGALGGITAGATARDPSLRGRLSENIAALEMFRDHPIVGVGPKNFELLYPRYAQRTGLDQRPEPRAAHSLYLESLAETGIVGSVPFALLLWVSLRRALRARRAAVDGRAGLLAEGCFVGLVTFLVAALTLHLAYPRYLWTFVALAFVAGNLAIERDAPAGRRTVAVEPHDGVVRSV